MRLPRVLALALLAVLGASHAAAQSDAEEPTIRSQVDPTEDLAALYPEAGHIGLAVAIVPDPHVPRYRRLFDLNVQAIQLGMLQDGYVLDRYAFPWSGTTGEDGPKDGARPADQARFGLMIFRCDGWRGRPCMDPATQPPRAARQRISSTRIRAVYFITDTATWGVSTPQLTCVAKQINAQLSGGVVDERSCADVTGSGTKDRRVSLLQFPGCPSGERMKTLVLLGPTFSGAVDSVGQHLGKLLGPAMTDACLVSGFTTVSSNLRTQYRYEKLHYARLALDDGVKLLGLANLAKSFGYFEPGREPEPGKPRREVAFLTEASTFGSGVCTPSETMAGDARERVAEFCASAQVLYFPAAIADIRYGLDQQKERKKNEVQAAVQAALPSEHLTLDVGAENGSEFPENRQSKLTAASQQLALDHVLNRLEQSDPRMVVVVATDVRDRLFLFDQLRQRLPSALLIDLETDVLLAHPDFLHASRGAVTVASANLFVQGGRLFGCETRGGGGRPRARVPLASWAIDGQGMLADAVSRLNEASPPLTAPPCVAEIDKIGKRMPVLHVVTLKGLRRISRAFERDEPKTGEAKKRARQMEDTRRWRQIHLSVAQWLALFCCVVIVVPWLWIRPMQHAKKAARYCSPTIITAITAVASCIAWLSAMFAAYAGDDPESGYSLAYWSIAVLAMAIAGLYICVRRVHECGPGSGKLPRRYRWAIRIVGFMAVALATVPVLMRGLSQTYVPPKYDAALTERAAIDSDLLVRLALDIGQGLAYHVVTAVGVVIILFVMVSLATGACIMTRNNGLLAIRTGSRDTDAGPRTPRFPSACIVGMILLIALIAVPSLVPSLGGPRLSIFGPAASLVATLVLVITTLGASILTSVAIHASRRIRTIAAHIGRCVTPKQVVSKDAEYPGLWPANDWQPNLFAATPVVARVSSDVVRKLNEGTLSKADDARSWKTLVSEFLGKREGKMDVNDGPHRRALYALLASEVSLYRWYVGGAVLCALASVCAAYLFPVEADPLIMWNLGVLVVHALLAGYVATAFERDGVLSNILCNRPKKAEFSASLFAYAAMPFLALGFAIAVSQVPGVVDWGGGVLALLGAIGVHL